MTEIWKYIPNSSFLISSLGRIKNTNTETLRNINTD